VAETKFLQSEQDHHVKAFEQYYALGEKRSYKRLAQELGVSRSTIKLWSRSFGWRQRVHERDAVVARKVADQAIQTHVDGQNQNRKIVQMALVRLAKAIAKGEIKMNLGDLERMIRLQETIGQEQKINAAGYPIPNTVEEFMKNMDDFMEQVPTEIIREATEILKGWQGS